MVLVLDTDNNGHGSNVTHNGVFLVSNRAFTDMVARVGKWLGDFGASHHVYDDLSLIWYVRVRNDPILIKQRLGEFMVYLTRTVRFECLNKEGVLVVSQLYITSYIPQFKVNMFSL